MSSEIEKVEYGQRPKDYTFSGMPSWVREMYRITERNAGRRRIPFTLTRQEFRGIVERSEGRCMMTGIEFEFDRFEGSCRRPFAPSLDRVRSTEGYSVNNCRLVCVLVNLALNQWGLEPLMRVANNLVQRQRDLRWQEDYSGPYKPQDFKSVKQFCCEKNIDLSKTDRVRLAHRASRLCNNRGIETVTIPIGKRIDGSPTMSFVVGYPLVVLEEAFALV